MVNDELKKENKELRDYLHLGMDYLLETKYYDSGIVYVLWRQEAQKANLNQSSENRKT